jgi:hypothetical protein
MGPKADPKGRGDMTVGNGKAKGLQNAADHSPALTTCGRPEDGGSTGTDSGSGGGGDGGIVIIS